MLAYLLLRSGVIERSATMTNRCFRSQNYQEVSAEGPEELAVVGRSKWTTLLYSVIKIPQFSVFSAQVVDTSYIMSSTIIKLMVQIQNSFDCGVQNDS